MTPDPQSANTLAASGQVQTGPDAADNESALPGGENESASTADANESGAAGDASIQPVLYRDDAFTPDDSNAALSVIHLSPDASAIGVTTSEGTVIAENVSTQNASDYATLPEGEYTCRGRRGIARARV